MGIMSRIKERFEALDGLVAKHSFAIAVPSMGGMFMVSLAFLLYAWRVRADADVRLFHLVVYVAVSGSYCLGVLIWEVIRQRRAHRQLISYVEGLRAYSVQNIQNLARIAQHVLDEQEEMARALQPGQVATELAQAPPVEVPGQFEHGQERGLSTRTRNIHIALIGVLCHELKIDVKRPAAAAAVIKEMTASQGLSIGETTIEELLKKVPVAFEARMMK